MQVQAGGIIDQSQKLKDQKVGDKDIKKTLIERGLMLKSGYCAESLQ